MEEEVICSRCNTLVSNQDTFCTECGYPTNGTQEEKDRYEYGIKLKRDVVEDAQKKLKNVKILLYVVAGLNVVVGLFYLSSDLTFADGIGSLIAGAIFLGCVVWVNKQPLTGILAAFAFWIVLQLLAILVDPTLIFRGILLKIIFIGIFIKGIASARDAKKFTDQLREMNAL